MRQSVTDICYSYKQPTKQPTEGSVLCSQQLPTCPYSEPDQTSPHSHPIS
jgi:hypothetical protein